VGEITAGRFAFGVSIYNYIASKNCLKDLSVVVAEQGLILLIPFEADLHENVVVRFAFFPSASPHFDSVAEVKVTIFVGGACDAVAVVYLGFTASDEFIAGVEEETNVFLPSPVKMVTWDWRALQSTTRHRHRNAFTLCVRAFFSVTK
jgi:hypothetical protein